ncbi:MAG TPA: hypothetical protein VFQ61_32660 [Polyangiaceae bacterium]|nr:hypothetical protein [Polyangiaceae bacterium]
MTNEQIFSAWAPDSSSWSRWAKPLLFAHIEGDPIPRRPRSSHQDASWCPPADGRFALILDLPCADGVWFGIRLAEHGYRLVPLYNSLPSTTPRVRSAVNVRPILRALRDAALILQTLQIPSNAPPAFLLDSRRQGRSFGPQDFDNRAYSFTTDFPSANHLLSQGIQNILLIQPTDAEPQSDLLHTLRAFQDGGLPLALKNLQSPAPPGPFNAPKPPWYRLAFQRALDTLGFHRAPQGGFGAIPRSSSG